MKPLNKWEPWPIYPSLYWLISVIQGSFSGIYLYFFFDAQAIGLRVTIFWLVDLIAIFSVIGLIMVWLTALNSLSASMHKRTQGKFPPCSLSQLSWL